MSRQNKFIDAEIAAYIGRHVTGEPEIAAELRRRTAAMPQANMQIGLEQGRLLQILLRLMQARHCIEIGVFTGYSSLLTVLALPSDGRLVACDVSEEWTAIAREYWQRAGVAEKIELRLQPARDTLAELLQKGGEGSFDFAFIDADKPAYDDYYEYCLKLLRPGGLIMLDNVLWSGRVVLDSVEEEDTVALRKLNRKMATDDRIRMIMLPMADGITLALKQ